MSSFADYMMLQQMFGQGKVTKDSSGLKKKDIKLIAEVLGVEFPNKKKEEKKEEAKKRYFFQFLETWALFAIAMWVFGPFIIWMQNYAMYEALHVWK